MDFHYKLTLNFEKYMIGSELHPIPEGSILNEVMLDLWCAHFQIPNTVDNRPGVLGSLVTLEKGSGTFPQALAEMEEFAPLLEAYKNPYSSFPEEKEEVVDDVVEEKVDVVYETEEEVAPIDEVTITLDEDGEVLPPEDEEED